MMRTKQEEKRMGVPGEDVVRVETPCSVEDCPKLFVAAVDETTLPEGWSFDAKANIRCEEHVEWRPRRVCGECRRSVLEEGAFDRCSEHLAAEVVHVCPACDQVMLPTTRPDNLICGGCTRESGGHCEAHNRAVEGYCPECTWEAEVRDLTGESLVEALDWVVERVDEAQRGVKRIDANTWVEMRYVLRMVRANLVNE